MLRQFRDCLQPFVQHQLQAERQMHSMAPVDLDAFITIAVVLTGGIPAGAMIHSLFSRGLDFTEKCILQGMAAFSIPTEESLHRPDLSFVAVDFHIFPLFLPIAKSHDKGARLRLLLCVPSQRAAVPYRISVFCRKYTGRFLPAPHP